MENKKLFFILVIKYPEENPLDYGNMNIKQQIMNFQAVQRNLKKKNEDISDEQYSKPNSKNNPPQIKEGKFIISTYCNNWKQQN